MMVTWQRHPQWYMACCWRGGKDPVMMVRLGCAVLGVSFVVEGYSLLVATRAVVQGAQAMGMSFWEYLRRGMDPTTVAVMMEDGAAVTGLLIAGENGWLCTMD